MNNIVSFADRNWYFRIHDSIYHNIIVKNDFIHDRIMYNLRLLLLFLIQMAKSMPSHLEHHSTSVMEKVFFDLVYVKSAIFVYSELLPSALHVSSMIDWN